ncbi:MAG: PfkB family carbohydrate kinase [Luteibaculaceae bacterium]
MMSLIIVGTVAFDALETPFGKRDKIVGGAATYASISASYFTKSTKIISVIGDDYSQEMLSEFKKRNIETEGLQVKKGEKSFFWKGKYHLDMNTRDTLATDLNVLANFNPVVPASYQDCDILLLGNLSPVVQMQVLEQLENRPKLVVLDTMNFWMDSAMEDLQKVLKKIDVLTINDEEARQLSGEYSLVKAAKKIEAMGPKFLVIKKGEHGALLFNEGKMFFAPALPLEDIMDPTGAGDTFAGGFVGFLASTKDISFDNMKRAVIAGSAMASFCVEKFGPERMLEISKDDIHKRIETFVQLVGFDIEVSE